MDSNYLIDDSDEFDDFDDFDDSDVYWYIYIYI